MVHLKHCNKLRDQLLRSLEERFTYAENDYVFTLAALLTPSIGLQFMAPNEVNAATKLLIDRVTDFALIRGLSRSTHTSSTSQSTSTSTSSSSASEPAKKRLRLYEYFEANKELHSRALNNLKPIELSIDEYIAKIRSNNYETSQNASFWLCHQELWPELSLYAKYILSIPATSAPIERVFSVGGSILSAKRRRLTDDVFRALIFIKCNEKL